MSEKHLLCIDDDSDIRELIGDVATLAGYTVHLADSPEVFFSSLSYQEPNVIITDLQMPEVDGIELIRQLANRGTDAAILIVSGFDSRVLSSAMQLGKSHNLNMLGTLQKPIAIDALERHLAKAMEHSNPINAGTLKAAIENQEIVVYYQPKATQNTDGLWQVTGVEALARWQHPKLGLVPPDKFIPLAEKSGLINALTDSVLKSAVRQLHAWRQEGLKLKCSVNVTAAELNDLAFPDNVLQLLTSYDLAADSLILEVTESTIMADPKSSLDILSRIRLKGFGLSIDDFGTGYSSLVQLHRMPCNELKIDKSFVLDLGANPESELIVKVILDLGHNLGMTVCAEGVENQEALSLLENAGCDMLQGYFISRPMPAEEISSFANWTYGK